MSLRRAHLHERNPAGEFLRGFDQPQNARRRKHHGVADRDQRSVLDDAISGDDMLCSRCPNPAFLRVDAKIVLCADCWHEVEGRLIADLNSDSAAASLPASGTAAGPTPSPQPPGPAANPSCGEAPGDGSRKQLSMASRLTPPRPQDSFPDMPDFLKRSSTTTLRVAASSDTQPSSSSSA